MAPLALSAAGDKKIPVGLELYSVRTELAKDLTATVTAVAKMGYQVVEFFAPYYQWTEDYAKQVRKLMDDLGIRREAGEAVRNSVPYKGWLGVYHEG